MSRAFLSLILWLATPALVSSAVAQGQSSPVTIKVIQVEDALWRTPDPRPECNPWTYEVEHQFNCVLPKSHNGRRTETDKCVIARAADDPLFDSNWCDATWVLTENTNVTYFALHADVVCTAYDRAGRALGNGSSSETAVRGGIPLDHFSKMNVLPASGKRGEGSASMIRLEKVKYADVARVDCRAASVSKD
jgi:hypothetical protein